MCEKLKVSITYAVSLTDQCWSPKVEQNNSIEIFVIVTSHVIGIESSSQPQCKVQISPSYSCDKFSDTSQRNNPPVAAPYFGDKVCLYQPHSCG